MKHQYKIYISSEDYQKLQEKAKEMGFSSRGGVSHFLSKLANQPLILLDENIKSLLKALNLKSE